MPVAEDDSELSRTVVIKVSSTGKPVIIDGLLTTPYYLSPAWVRYGGVPPVPAAATSDTTVKALAASFDGTCAVRTDGSVACWGNNDASKAVPPSGSYQAVAQGDYHTCAIRDDGALACWGLNEYGELTPPENGPYTAIAAGYRDTCAIGEGGDVDCWGLSVEWDELSDPDGEFTALAASGWGFCGLRTDGTIWCWGSDYEYGGRTWPEGEFTAVAGRCAVRVDGSVLCWGSDILDRNTPPATSFKQVSAGPLHACGIQSDDTLACWGDNNYFEATPPSGTYRSVAVGWAHSCAIAMDGTLACWGDNLTSQVVPRPIAALKGPGGWVTSPTMSLSWSATGLAPVTGYDVRYRKAAWNGKFGSPVTVRAATKETSASLSGSAGATYCFSARALDAAGLASAWTTEACTGVPLDDRALATSGSWTRGSNSLDYKSTYSRAKASGASLTRTGVSTRRITLLATTCPTCGKVSVYWGSRRLKTISLVSSTTVHRKLFTVETFSSVKTGTLKIKVVSSGKKVIIDGVGLRRD